MSAPSESQMSNTDDIITELFFDNEYTDGADVPITTDRSRYMDIITCGYRCIQNTTGYNTFVTDLPELSAIHWEPREIQKFETVIKILGICLAGFGEIVEWKNTGNMRNDILTVMSAFRRKFPDTPQEIHSFVTAYNRMKNTTLHPHNHGVNFERNVDSLL